MTQPVIVSAARSAIGKRNGSLTAVHPATLLGATVEGMLTLSGIDPAAVDQLIAGCVTQIGEQGANVARNAWLGRGMPYPTGATTIDFQCGSSQQAVHLIAGLIAADAIETGVAAGVEAMSRIPLGSNVSNGPGKARPEPFPWDLPSSQFEAAERIAGRWNMSRNDVDEFAVWSQAKAVAAWESGSFDAEILQLTFDNGATIARDEGPRPSTREKLSTLKPVLDGGLHTAGNSSQISDGSAALLLMSQTRAAELGAQPRARIVAQAAVGSDPYYYLDGPADATRAALKRSGMNIEDIDVIEINEAFAAVPLSWMRQFDVSADKVNGNGGAIALGHPVGATGARLLTTALHTLERTEKSTALVTMCCGGALATATIIERI